jgi:hypothetical protein
MFVSVEPGESLIRASVLKGVAESLVFSEGY